MRGNIMPALTSDEYALEFEGLKCPACTSTQVNQENWSIEGGFAWAEISCKTCGSYWTDKWELVGYEALEIPDGSPTNIGNGRQKNIPPLLKRR